MAELCEPGLGTTPMDVCRRMGERERERDRERLLLSRDQIVGRKSDEKSFAKQMN